MSQFLFLQKQQIKMRLFSSLILNVFIKGKKLRLSKLQSKAQKRPMSGAPERMSLFKTRNPISMVHAKGFARPPEPQMSGEFPTTWIQTPGLLQPYAGE